MSCSPVIIFRSIPYDGSTSLCPCCQERERDCDFKILCSVCREACPNAPYQCACGRWFDGR